MPTNEPKSDDAAVPGHVASTDLLGAGLYAELHMELTSKEARGWDLGPVACLYDLQLQAPTAAMHLARTARFEHGDSGTS